ncbi:hypothetical protein [uncultured Bacteroides sp.]|jgi:lipoprotein|uniref:hypothetical protein n=1 Tax=uncultured Bacteroides sp. TaxID=162156 RepID=UPI00280BD81E|nr:hypothetical protein [uncultured Bacteroides sp.]
MKKIMMFAAIAVAALSSCSNSEVVDMSAGNAIGFETYVGKATTKGTPVSGGTFADTSTMRVWGCTSADQLGTDYTAVTGLIPNLSSGTKVSKAGGVWSYTPLAYWKANVAHSFFACSPFIDDSSLSYNQGKFTYIVKDNISEQVDFMVADPIKKAKWNGTEEMVSQVFNFHHALSQIKFSAKIVVDAEETVAKNVRVKSILMENMEADETIASTLATTNTIDVIGKTDANAITYTSAATGTVNGYTVTPTTPVVLPAASTTPADYTLVNHAAGDEILMLMPQTTTGKVRFTITFVYDTATATGLEKDASFITNAAQTWAPNKIYSYKFDINMPNVMEQKPVVFGEPTVNTWTDDSEGESLDNN